MTIKIMLNNVVASQSKNLRGVRRYAQQYPVVKATIAYDAGLDSDNQRLGFNVEFTFYNGAVCNTMFSSKVVARNWILDRRSWGKPKTSQIQSTPDNFAHLLVFTY